MTDDRVLLKNRAWFKSVVGDLFAAIEEKIVAQLCDPDKMPDGLREAHHQLDLAVNRPYRGKPVASDEERLESLFKLDEKMTAKEKSAP